MNYIPVEVFIECMQTSGIKSKYEYYELHNRDIVPTDLMPKSPALENNNMMSNLFLKIDASNSLLVGKFFMSNLLLRFKAFIKK